MRPEVTEKRYRAGMLEQTEIHERRNGRAGKHAEQAARQIPSAVVPPEAATP